MTKSELFKFAHKIAKLKNIAFFGSYQRAFGHVLRELYAKGYQRDSGAFKIKEPWYKRNRWDGRAGRWATP